MVLRQPTADAIGGIINEKELHDAQQRANDIMQEALRALGEMMIEHTGATMPVPTAWALVIEWDPLEGDKQLTRYTSMGLPAWQRNGLLGFAMKEWGSGEEDDL